MCCQKMIIDRVMGRNGFVIIGVSPEGHQKKKEFESMIHHGLSRNTSYTHAGLYIGYITNFRTQNGVSRECKIW